MRVSCLMPTYNRLGPARYLVDEAVESFLRQDHADRELIVLNDTPGQPVEFRHPLVRVVNFPERLPTLSDKLAAGIAMATGDVLCRWDDDDASLPWRLSYSLARLGDAVEWRPENHWFDRGFLTETKQPGNSHVMGVWTRAALEMIGGYPPKRSGTEDQEFNRLLAAAGGPNRGEVLPQPDIFYLYRWNTGGMHLSGIVRNSGDMHADCQHNYERFGTFPVTPGVLKVEPHWRQNHVFRASQAARLARFPAGAEPWAGIGGYFDFAALYDRVARSLPTHARVVEVGCLYGRSLVYLAHAAKRHGKRAEVWGVDLGAGLDGAPDYHHVGTLTANVRAAGVQDVVRVVAAESTAGAAAFADGTLDFAFVDAAHDYHSVRCDLQAWWPKVKPGGLLAGHDYRDPGSPGVAKAVDEFFGVEPGGCQSPDTPSCWERRKP